ncbi:hypothetical protein ZEAMMB73_Zm00001d049836 [Zea mays]|uniref:Uncharacterized protein n=1 Tax=Zea mays TaxID=4577 RepID=A0A1D6PYD7_MAIZE|nr:hypothetical protein ZEAMMB73_Zm00001d049836 [Zea mays]
MSSVISQSSAKGELPSLILNFTIDWLFGKCSEKAICIRLIFSRVMQCVYCILWLKLLTALKYRKKRTEIVRLVQTKVQ